MKQYVSPHMIDMSPPSIMKTPVGTSLVLDESTVKTPPPAAMKQV